MTRRRSPAWCVLVLALLATPLRAAIAQSESELLGAAVQPKALNPEDLLSDNRNVVRDARNRILEPLMDPNITVQARIDAGRQYLPVLARAAADQRDFNAVNALRIAGELATDAGVDLLNSSRSDARAPVRYAAIFGLKRTFQALDKSAPAILPPAALNVVSAVGRQFGDEQDPNVLAACVGALTAAAAVQRPGYEGAREAALGELIRRATEHVKALGEAPTRQGRLPALLQAGLSVREALLNPNQAFPPGLVPAATEFGQQMLNYVVRRLDAGDLTPSAGDGPEEAARKNDQRQVAIQVVKVGESLRVLTRAVEDRHLAELLAVGTPEKDQEFKDRVRP